MKINKKGFTLIELLVVITIIGIITVLALPGVQQLQARNRNKKFEAYSNTLENAGKLYTDSYSVDMFGMTGNGCSDIPFSELNGKSLIKDYTVEGITCDDDKTFVHVEKVNGKYTYGVSLYCTKDGKVVYDNVLPKCGAATTALPTISATYENVGGSDGWSKSKNINIKITARDGFREQTYITYGFTTTPGVAPTNLETHTFPNEFGELEVNLPFTVDNLNGKYYLYVNGDYVVDTGGRFAEDYYSDEPLKFDNTPPVINSLTNPTNSNWAGLTYVDAGNYVLTGVASDQGETTGEGSGIGKWSYKYPNSENVEHIYANSATKNFVTTPFSAERDEVVEIRVYDKAGNSSSITSTIRIDKTAPTCTVTKSGTAGTNNWYTSNVNLTLNPTDNGAVKSPISYGINNTNSPLYDGTTTKAQSETTGITWYGFIKDAAGNESTCNSGNLKVDTSKPTTPTITNPTTESSGNVKWVNYNFALTVKSLDVYSGIETFQYTYKENATSVTGNNSTGWVTYSNSSANPNTEKSFKTTDFSAERNQLVYLRVCDKAGLCSDVSSTTIRIDKTKPTISITKTGTAGTNGWYKAKNLSLTLVANDAASGLNGSDLTTSSTATYNGNTTGTQSDTTGTTWYAYAKDAAGNVNSLNETYKVDTVSPTCKLKVDSSNVSFDTKTDATSKIKSSGINKSTTASYSATTGTTAAATFYGHVLDNAGNTGRCSAEVKSTTVNQSCPNLGTPPNCYYVKEVCSGWCTCVGPNGELYKSASSASESGCKQGCFSSNGPDATATYTENCENTYPSQSPTTWYTCSSGYTKLGNSWCYKIG